jgi:hypothetical protein
VVARTSGMNVAQNFNVERRYNVVEHSQSAAFTQPIENALEFYPVVDCKFMVRHGNSTEVRNGEGASGNIDRFLSL